MRFVDKPIYTGAREAGGHFFKHVIAGFTAGLGRSVTPCSSLIMFDPSMLIDVQTYHQRKKEKKQDTSA